MAVARLAAALGVLFALGAPTPAVAQGGGQRSGAAAFTRDVLPGGLVVLVEERPGSGLVAVEVAMLAGARFEYGPTAGAAQFMEQLFQDGTPTRPTRGDVLRAITARGGDLTVEAGWERVRLAAEMASEDFDVALNVLSDMLLHSTFSEERFEAERTLILQNLAEREDTPSAVVLDLAQSTALGDPEMRYLPSGSPQAIRGLAYRSLLGYRAARVVSGNTIVAVAGDVRREDVLPRIQRTFAELPPGPRSRPTALPRQSAPSRIERPAGSEQANVAIAMRTPGVRAPDRAAMVVLSGILGYGGRRLFDEIRDRRGLAYSADASIMQMTDTGVMLALAGTDPANTDEVADLLLAELRRIRTTAPSSEEVERAISYLVDGQIVDLETNAARASDLTRREGLYGVAPPREVFLEQVRAVRPPDVLAAARRYLAPERLTTVILRPE